MRKLCPREFTERFDGRNEYEKYMVKQKKKIHIDVRKREDEEVRIQ